MILNFNQPFIDLDGKQIEETNQGKTLSQALAQSLDAKETDVLKFWDWATKLHKGEEIDLDQADQVKLKAFIDKSNFNVLVKHNLLENFSKKEKK